MIGRPSTNFCELHKGDSEEANVTIHKPYKANGRERSAVMRKYDTSILHHQKPQSFNDLSIVLHWVLMDDEPPLNVVTRFVECQRL